MVPMNNVYLDILFLTNFFADYITLLCTAKVNGALIYRKFIILAAMIGSIYACLCTIFSGAWFHSIAVRLSFSVILCLMAFHRESNLLRCCITYLIISSVFGGILSIFVLYSQQQNYIVMNPKVFVLAFAIIYILLSKFYRKTGNVMIQTHYEAEISFSNHCIKITVLKDTGNELIDPISNLPVLIIERKQFVDLTEAFAINDANKSTYDLFYELSTITELKGKLRLIPCQSISGKDVLLGIVPDQIILDGRKTDMIVAYTNYKLSEQNLYQGIC